MSEAAQPLTTDSAGAGLGDGARTGVFVEYFTDPLCCWSWAMEPPWRRLRFEFRGQVRWRYRMVGMIESWQSYCDPVNVIHRPVQMAPFWSQARHLSGMPMADRLWISDPPDSSYPACLAVAAAGLQSPAAQERMLRAVREAVMLQGRNIGRTPCLLEVAGDLARRWPGGLDVERFARDFQDESAREAFREDLSRTRYQQIGRYPTLVMRWGDRALAMTGCRPYEQLRDAMRDLAPELTPSPPPSDRSEYEAYWGGVLDREWREFAAPVAS